MRVKVGNLIQDDNTIATSDQEKADTLSMTFERVFTIEDTSQMLTVPHQQYCNVSGDSQEEIREPENQ